MKKLVLALLLCLPLHVLAQLTGLISPEGFKFNTDNTNRASITGHTTRATELAGVLVIPAQVTDSNTGISYPVRSIGGFMKYLLLTGLELPEGLTSIAGIAFTGCSGLAGELRLPTTLTSIGNSAFQGCSGLTGDLVIPDKVTTIGNSAFQKCTGFTGTLTLSPKLSSISANAFQGCSGLTGDLVIPDKVTTINSLAFQGCTGFTGTLTLPENLKTIGSSAFQGCTGFTGTLTLPENLTSLQTSAFENCRGFTGTLVIPEGITTIAVNTFSTCRGISSVQFHPNVTQIGGKAFVNCSGLQGQLQLPAALKSIGYEAFRLCTGLSGTLNWPDGLEEIGSNAFSNCSGFTGELSFPASVTVIQNSAFESCSGFTSLVLPENLAAISASTFKQCTGLTGTLTIPASVQSIGGSAFWNCSNLKGHLLIPENVTVIDRSAFGFCQGFTGITLPSGLTKISAQAFYQCSGITEPVSIPAGVTTIESEAFRLCSSMPAVELPSGLVSIGSYAFASCHALQLPTFPQGLQVVGSQAFYLCKNFRGDVLLPNTVTRLDGEAFHACKSLTGFTLAEGSQLELLGDRVWRDCDSLEYIDLSHIPASVMNGTTLSRTSSDGLNSPFYRLLQHTVVYLPDGCTPNKSVDVYPVNNVLDGVCREFSVQDAWDYELPHPFTALKANYNNTSRTNYRTFAGSTCKTMYLPYPATLPQGLRAYRLNKRDEYSQGAYEHYFQFVAVDDEATLEPNTAYILRVTDGKTKQFGTDENVYVPATPAVDETARPDRSGEWLFCGTTEKIDNATAAAQSAYNLKDNVWHPISTIQPSGYVNHFRCFIKPASGQVSPIKSFAIFLSEDDTETGLAETHAALRRGQAHIHNLQGQYVGVDFDSLPEGVYLVNGKKVCKM